MNLRKAFSLNNMIKKIYIAGPLFNVHEKKYLEEIAEVLEGADFECFLPHRDQTGIDPEELKNNEMSQATKDIIFQTDIEALERSGFNSCFSNRSRHRFRNGIRNRIYVRKQQTCNSNYR